MKIGGLQKLSLIDYPGKPSAVVFTQGCNFRCGYCHNPELVYPHLFKKTIIERTVMEFLQSRKGKLEGIVISGGEPTLHNDLPEFIGKIKAIGYDVKLDTNGSNPQMLENLLEKKLVDFVAMDIKATDEKYNRVCGININMDKIRKSIVLLETSAVQVQFRSIVIKNIHSEEDLVSMKKTIKQPLKIQGFRFTNNIQDNRINIKNEFSDEEILKLEKLIEDFFYNE